MEKILSTNFSRHHTSWYGRVCILKRSIIAVIFLIGGISTPIFIHAAITYGQTMFYQ